MRLVLLRARATCAAPQYFREYYHEPSQMAYIDGAVFHNNPIQIADAERKALWPDVTYPDVMLSIGTALSSVDDPVLLAKETRLRKARKRFVSHLQHLLSILKMNMDAALDCDKAFDEYSANITSGMESVEKDTCLSRLFCINPRIATRLPALDEYDKMDDLWDKVRASLKNDPAIPKVARQLIASSFYFHLLGPIKDGLGGKHQVKGTFSLITTTELTDHL